MKSSVKTSIKILLIGYFLSLFSCATTGQFQQYTKGSIIDMGHYCVTGPPGDGWFVNIQEDKGVLEFEKRNVSGATGIINDTMLIRVFWNWIADKRFWHLSDGEVANDYRDREETDMIGRGVMTGQYELSDVKKGITMIGDKRVYSMSYKTLGWSNGPARKKVIGEAMLYLLFPADFKERHVFYGFLINHSYEQGSPEKGDLSPITPVINSFEIK